MNRARNFWGRSSNVTSEASSDARSAANLPGSVDNKRFSNDIRLVAVALTRCNAAFSFSIDARGIVVVAEPVDWRPLMNFRNESNASFRSDMLGDGSRRPSKAGSSRNAADSIAANFSG